MSASGIRLRGLGKRYPANPLEMLGAIFFARGSKLKSRRGAGPALHDVDLEIRAGERVGVLGENGAGKSTLLGILAGTIEPSEGRCEIDGQVTAILTLGTGMREELTGRENVAIAVALHDTDHAESVRRVADAIEFTELGDKIDAPVRTYSTGMKARLAFATLVHGTPEILVVDEALSVGDAFFAAKASAKLKQLCDRGRIVVIVSHSMESLVKLCDRCIWLHAGQVRMDGPSAEVTSAYVKWVRDNDERAMLERYRDHQRADLLDPRLASLEMKLGTDDVVAVPILASGEPLDVRLQIGLAPGTGPAHLHLSLARLDGVKVLEERYPPGEGAIVAAGIRKALAARLDALPLASGMYVVRVQVDSENAVLGQATAVLEVRAPKGVGGQPLLHSPVEIAVERLGSAGAAA